MLNPQTESATAPAPASVAPVIHLPAGELHAALSACKHAISREETRYYLNGVYTHWHAPDSTLRFVATDGHRMTIAAVPNLDLPTIPRPVILSRDFVLAILKALSKHSRHHYHVGLQLDAATATLYPHGAEPMTGNLIDGTFPDYVRVIPRDEKARVDIKLDSLRIAVERCTAFLEAGDNTPALTFALAGKVLTITAKTQDEDATASVTATVPIDTATALPLAAPMTIGFNGRYVCDILGTMDKSSRSPFITSWFLTDPGAPVQITNPRISNVTHVLMPMRV